MTTHSMVVFGYDDWHGLYKDGKLFHQNHQIRMYDLIQAAEGRPFFLTEPEVDESAWFDWVEANGLPENYNSIPKEVFA